MTRDIAASIRQRLLNHARASGGPFLNVSAFVARQKVTGYVLDHVSDHLAGDEPSLVVDGERFLWRVPVYLAVLPQGRLGHVGMIDVDAQNGQLLVTETLVEEIRRNAWTLVERPSA